MSYTSKKTLISMGMGSFLSVTYPDDKIYDEIPNYDIVGFGSGIDTGRHYAPMLEFTRKLLLMSNKKAFIFSTRAILGKRKVKKDHTALREILRGKGYEIMEEFACKGYNTNSFLKYIGRMNKGHPSADDLQNAAAFARRLGTCPKKK